MNPLKIRSIKTKWFIRSWQSWGKAKPVTITCAAGDAQNLTKPSRNKT
jgi:hypothetical protein